MKRRLWIPLVVCVAGLVCAIGLALALADIDLDELRG